MEQIYSPTAYQKETAAAIMMLNRNTNRHCSWCTARRPVSPILFTICLDYVLRTSIDKIKENGFKLTKERSRRYYLPTPPLGQDMTQGQFLSEFNRFEFRVFPSPRLVASPRLKNLVRPTIYHSWRENKGVHTFPRVFARK